MTELTPSGSTNVERARILRVAVLSLAGLLAFVVVAALIAWGVTASNRSDAAAAASERRDFSKANVICGNGPAAIKTHGPSWSYGPWLEVTCKDGTKRAIRP